MIASPICEICGQPLEYPTSSFCQRCQQERDEIAFSAVRSWAVFGGPLKRAVHQLKYKKNLGLCTVFGGYLSKLLDQLGWQIDLITPVPLDRNRYRQRGYNQALCLARSLGWSADIPVKPRALARVRVTKSQVGLRLEERRENVADAFRAEKTLTANLSVLVLDDVVTTGATINACAVALRTARAKKVYGLTLARAL
jgi:ComF family protein